MPSVIYPQAELVSFCGSAQPRFATRVTDHVTRRLAWRELLTQCQKRAEVDSVPALQFVASGGNFNADPVTWSAPGGGNVVVSRVGGLIRVSGDLKDNVSQIQSVVDAQRRLLEEVIWQRLGQALMTRSPGPNDPVPLSAYAAANPNGEIDVAGKPLTPEHMTCLRSRITPWDPEAQLAYMMNSRTLENYERTCRDRGAPVQFLPHGKRRKLFPHCGPYPIYVSDFLSLQETVSPDTSSVYLVRMGDGDADPAGVDGFALVAPAGQTGIQSTGLMPLDDGTDTFQQAVYMTVGTDGGSSGAGVAVIKRVSSAH